MSPKERHIQRETNRRKLFNKKVGNTSVTIAPVKPKYKPAFNQFIDDEGKLVSNLTRCSRLKELLKEFLPSIGFIRKEKDVSDPEQELAGIRVIITDKEFK